MEYPNKLSQYMSFEEATRSQTATRHNIDNTPNKTQLQNMIFISKEIFDPIREFVGGPLTCSSFLRVDELNDKIGGSPRSYHRLGAAIDLKKISSNHSYKEIFDFIKDNLPYSELIWEFGNKKEPAWVHVAYLKGVIKKDNIKRFYFEDGKRKKTMFDLY